MDELKKVEGEDIALFTTEDNVQMSNLVTNSGNKTAYVTTKVGTRSERVEEKKYLSFNLELTLYAYLNINNGKISSVGPVAMTLGGWTPGLKLNENSVVTNYTISSSGYSTHISGECDIDLYAVISSSQLGVKLYTDHHKLNIYHGL